MKFIKYKKTEYKGIIYDSATEAEIAEYLDTLLKQKKIKAWDRQLSFKLPMMGQYTLNIDRWTGKCTLDFCVTTLDDKELHIDAKGTWSMKLVQNKMAELRYRLFEVIYRIPIYILEKKTYKETLNGLIVPKTNRSRGMA